MSKQKQIESLIGENLKLYAELRCVQEERDQLRAEAEALRKDAERYRWLRDNGTFAPSVFGNGWALACGSRRYGAGDLNAAVDSAMAAKDID